MEYVVRLDHPTKMPVQKFLSPFFFLKLSTATGLAGSLIQATGLTIVKQGIDIRISMKRTIHVWRRLCFAPNYRFLLLGIFRRAVPYVSEERGWIKLSGDRC